VEGETLVIEDLGSSNGTFVDDERIEGPVRLREGDVIRLGGTTLEFRYETTQLDDATPTEATSVYQPD
jgi:pSer/pThr/pTyr-binding forkhead associated (FHA) protein